MRELTAELAQVKQQLEEEHGKNEKLTAGLKVELAQLKQASQDGEKPEKPLLELTAELARVKQQLQEERDKNEKLAVDMMAELAQLKQAAQEWEKPERPMRELTAELAQVKQQLLAERSRPTGPPIADASRTDEGTSKDNSTKIAKSTTGEPQPGSTTGSSDLVRLLARATLFLSQGNVSTARLFLELAAERGSASAIFALAETYDPAVLAAWGTFGTQGDPAKAKDLYQKALAGGVQEATDRLRFLQ
jgi:TPR repeat protein